jgi:hypothetical protein
MEAALVFLKSLAPSLVPELESLEAQGFASLDAMIASDITSPDLKAILPLLVPAVEACIKYETDQLSK